jgi:hypothetical protein
MLSLLQKKGAELILVLTPALSTQYPAQCGMKSRRFEVSAFSPLLEYGRYERGNDHAIERLE